MTQHIHLESFFLCNYLSLNTDLTQYVLQLFTYSITRYTQNIHQNTLYIRMNFAIFYINYLNAAEATTILKAFKFALEK